jgi:integrase
MFQFAVDNGYVSENPFNGIKPLKRARIEPDPLTRDEFVRFIDACKHQQTKNLWSIAVYTGLRHGELVSLAWEDIIKIVTHEPDRQRYCNGQTTEEDTGIPC